ncbi:Large subunit GTPase 1 [Metarhizium anisopliae]|nr:Large subunit GTPase 1 [Metarhizium anisopliae]
MVLAKSKKSVGLGNTLMNDRFGKGKGSDRKKQSTITRTNHATGEQYLVNEKQDASWVKMRSVTEQGALDEFLATAELAGTDFTAEKMNNVKIIHTDQKNPYLLSANEERTVLGKHKMHRGHMMTLAQRRAWAKHLKKAGIAYKFFSAQLAKELNEARDEDGGSEDEVEKPSSHSAGKQPATGEDSSEEESEDDGGAPTAVDEDEDTQILTVEELEDIFLQHSPKDAASDHKLQVGLVGYPNVGKSSTINALIGAKKVSVSSTPGKTKHFQTIHLSENVILCDCPGLVFPNFAFTKADLVCNGVLPIDQMREYTGPVGLVTQRIPQRFLEAIYGIQIKTRPLEEGGSGIPTGEELLRAYAKARGFQTQGLGQPDEARASRYILKDYVNGKLLFVHPPPGIEDAKAFNRELYSEFNLPEKRRAALAAATEAMSLKDDDSVTVDSDMVSIPAGPKTEKLDARFFGPDKSQGHIAMPFNHKYTEQGQAAGRMLTGRKARTVVALENGIDPKDVQLLSSKKHFKGGAKNGKSKKHRYMNTDD